MRERREHSLLGSWPSPHAATDFFCSSTEPTLAFPHAHTLRWKHLRTELGIDAPNSHPLALITGRVWPYAEHEFEFATVGWKTDRPTDRPEANFFVCPDFSPKKLSSPSAQTPTSPLHSIMKVMKYGRGRKERGRMRIWQKQHPSSVSYILLQYWVINA